jgi:ribonucleoside-diphosphate reductase alpha chain
MVEDIMDHLHVIKRDGTRVPVSFDEIRDRLQSLANGLEHVNPDIVAQKVCLQLQDNIKTSQLDDFAAEVSAMMSARYHPNYAFLAARIVISNHQKQTPSSLYECVYILLKDKNVSQEYFDNVNTFPEKYEELIDYSRDFMFDYFGFKTLEKGYLLRNAKGQIIERPQHLWMRLAIQLHGLNLGKVKETYDALSQGHFIHATPTLFNAGTNHPQLSSCFLVQLEDDSIKGIYGTLADCAQISKWAGGIGINIHNVRAKDSHIKGTNGKSTGIVPMLKVYNDTAKYVNQGGKRNGSFAIYLEPWHADIEDFLRLRLNTGVEDERARDLFYALWIPDLFMKRVDADGVWSLMSPDVCPGLDEAHGEEFEKLYEKYEQEKKYFKQVPAKKIWQMILDAQIQTGSPYLCYKDAANSKSNQQHLGTIKSSNLCAEIIEYSSSDESAVCNLGSLSLPSFITKDNKFDFDLLRKNTRILTRNLDIVIDKNFYPTEKCRTSNMKHRPIGIGVQGLADVFARLRLSWVSKEAAELNREIFENIYFAALTESIQVAQEKGVMTGDKTISGGEHPSYKGSPMSNGKLQYDLWNDPPRRTDYLDWNAIKYELTRSGVRNSLLVALMPTASTSQILGNNECFEPFTSNMYSRRVLAGDFVVINKYLVNDLVERQLWTSDVRTQILANNGSIQSIMEIPSEIRELYKIVWEIPQKTLIQMSRDRAPFVCQSQSLNLFVAEPSYSKISAMHFFAWRQGLKTGCYYLRTKAAASTQKFTVEPPSCLTCSA